MKIATKVTLLLTTFIILNTLALGLIMNRAGEGVGLSSSATLQWGIAILSLAGLTTWIYGSLLPRLRRLSRFADGVANRAQLEQRLVASSNDELGALEIDVNRLACRLSELSERPVQTEEQEAPPPMLDAKPRAVVADGNSHDRVTVKGFLEHMGFNVDLVEDGVSLIAAVRDAPTDLVVLDTGLEHLDGYEATIVIRELDLPWSKPPIIGVSSVGSGDTRAACIRAGMVDLVTKPFELGHFQTIVERGVWVSREPQITEDIIPALFDEVSRPLQYTPVPPIDAIVGVESSMSRENWQDLVERFVSSLEMRLDRMREAISEGERGIVIEEANSIRSEAELVGAEEVGTAALELECSTDGSIDELEDAFESMCLEFLRLREYWYQLTPALA